MLNPAIDLYRKFNEIRKQGWIKTMSNDLQGVGYTFERLINKNVDNFWMVENFIVSCETLLKRGKLFYINCLKIIHFFM